MFNPRAMSPSLRLEPGGTGGIHSEYTKCKKYVNGGPQGKDFVLVTLLLYQRLEPTLSKARLESYRIDDCTDFELLVNYYWNVALAEALHSSLHATEVALRNSIHSGFSQRFGTTEWYDIDNLLEEHDSGLVSAVRQGAAVRNQPAPTADQMVSRLSFGFWTHMVSSRYDEAIWSPDHWTMVRTVFSYGLNETGKRLGRNVLGQHYNEVRFLRNRVAHFEQIFNSNRLIRNHAAIHDGIGWIDPVLQAITENTDSFPAVYYGGRPTVRDKLAEFIVDGPG